MDLIYGLESVIDDAKKYLEDNSTIQGWEKYAVHRAKKLGKFAFHAQDGPFFHIARGNHEVGYICD